MLAEIGWREVEESIEQLRVRISDIESSVAQLAERARRGEIERSETRAKVEELRGRVMQLELPFR